ncbi:MAG: hypothetical protein ACKOEC_19350 [Acidimicrobiia bacterium]
MKRSSVEAETRQEEILFIKRWLAHPLKVGALLPSPPFLARMVARHTLIGGDDVVVELGAGTGAVTKALLDAGIPKDRLFVIEIVADMCTYLASGMRRRRSSTATLACCTTSCQASGVARSRP